MCVYIYLSSYISSCIAYLGMFYPFFKILYVQFCYRQERHLWFFVLESFIQIGLILSFNVWSIWRLKQDLKYLLRNGISENERNFRKVNFFSIFPVKVTGQSWGVCRAQVAACTSIRNGNYSEWGGAFFCCWFLLKKLVLYNFIHIVTAAQVLPGLKRRMCGELLLHSCAFC